jgi:hypothetical protein
MIRRITTGLAYCREFGRAGPSRAVELLEYIQATALIGESLAQSLAGLPPDQKDNAAEPWWSHPFSQLRPPLKTTFVKPLPMVLLANLWQIVSCLAVAARLNHPPDFPWPPTRQARTAMADAYWLMCAKLGGMENATGVRALLARWMGTDGRAGTWKRACRSLDRIEVDRAANGLFKFMDLLADQAWPFAAVTTAACNLVLEEIGAVIGPRHQLANRQPMGRMPEVPIQTKEISVLKQTSGPGPS